LSAADVYNAIEIVLWALIGLGFAAAAFLPKTTYRWRAAILALAFFLFALSDYIEIQTGSWWSPIWLLLLKVGCVAVFVLAFRHHLMMTKARPEDSGEDTPR
jgi:hypothetical protein